MNLRLANIQRCCVNDGPGIRTTIFAYGCGIQCPWCANPECLYTNSEITECSVDRVLDICRRDRAYYSNGGGITASGGEALLQAEGFEELFVKAKSEGIGTCVETSLYAPKNNLDKMIPATDSFIVDFKILNEDNAKNVLNGDYSLFINNLDCLFHKVDRDKILIRIPLVPGITYTEDNIAKAVELLNYYKPNKCEIFSVHNLGREKYIKLGMAYNEFEVIDKKHMDAIKDYFQRKTSVDVKCNEIL